MRRLIRTATQIVSEGYTGGEDVSGMLSEAERRILEISIDARARIYCDPRRADGSIREGGGSPSEPGNTTGIPSGFVDLDKMTSGFQRNDLIIVAVLP